MNSATINKRKNINDPVYGFITIPGELIFDIIEHPWFQRLRRIRQLGLTEIVYPSATHSRFQHALGCMHLMKQAINVIREKGVDIPTEEEAGVLLAILLHDIGHGPFSHTLERSIIPGLSHEDISILFIEELNRQFGGCLSATIGIFTNRYHRKFLHQLVSGQLDMDRLDYLARDSFFTGVAEGVINTDRIINMLNVADDKLVVEEKGIYSIEKFILARRLMYWQVYLHKTVLAADQMLVSILRRARNLAGQGVSLPASPALSRLLKSDSIKGFQLNPSGSLDDFSKLDDNDIISATKVWCNHPDPVLSLLSSRLINRQLFRMEMQKQPFPAGYIETIIEATKKHFHVNAGDAGFLVVADMVSNDAYEPGRDKILVKTKRNEVMDLAEASEQLSLSVLSTPAKRYILSYPKEISGF